MSNGQQVVPAPLQVHYGSQIKKSNGMAVAGFVLALLGVLGSFIPFVNLFCAFLALLGLIFGIVGLAKSGSSGPGKGLSIAAIILAVPAIVVSIVITAVAASWMGTKVKEFEISQRVPATVTGKVGQSVKDGKLTFVVKSVKCGMTTYGASLPSKSLGEFCAVDVSVSNHAKSAMMFEDITVEGFVAGSRYEANSVATATANPKTNALLSIEPGNLVKAVVLIDVPVGQQLDTVELHDSPFSDGTSVSVK